MGVGNRGDGNGGDNGMRVWNRGDGNGGDNGMRVGNGGDGNGGDDGMRVGNAEGNRGNDGMRVGNADERWDRSIYDETASSWFADRNGNGERSGYRLSDKTDYSARICPAWQVKLRGHDRNNGGKGDRWSRFNID